MTGRVVLLALVASVLAHVDAAPATADAELRAPIYYLGRADQRLCPSPMCGGIWLRAVNGAAGNCAQPRGHECYVTGLDGTHARLSALVTEHGGLVLGRMEPARLAGFPDLRVLDALGVWRAASKRRPSGVFRTLRDNGVRCVREPCFSVTATALNTGRAATVSTVDLSATGATAAQARRASNVVARRGLLTAGSIVRTRDGGRAFVASQIYFRAG